MKYYVFHNDDYPGMGGIGLKEFDYEKDAIEFIDDRISITTDQDRVIKNYTVIRGTKMELKAVKTVTKVRLS